MRRSAGRPEAGSPTTPQSAGDRVLGRVAELWRYPVKSLGGERLDHATCARRGLEGDRVWAVVGEDGRIGSGKTTRRFRRMPGLLSSAARTDEHGRVWVIAADGAERRVEDPETAERVSAVVGERVRLAREGDVPHFDDGPLHVVTGADLEAAAARSGADGRTGAGTGGSAAGEGTWTDRRRFRPNVVVDAAERLVPGGRYLVGASVVLGIGAATERCVMVTLTQPGLGAAPGLLKHLERTEGGCLGVYAAVLEPGVIALGDLVTELA